MAADSIAILIKAKNLTDQAFAAVRKDVQRLGKETASASKGIQGQFRQVNDVLELVGLNMRDQVGAFEQLQGAAGKTAGQVGLLGTAGLVAGAAFGGWQIGRKLAELTGSDTLIGNVTAKLFGLGDAAAEGAGAKMDVLARASRNAGREITDLTEAIRINHEATQRSTDAVARSNAFEAGARQVAKWREELQALQSAGVLEHLRKDLLSQVHSQKDLADRYRVSGDALRLFNQDVTAEKTVLDKATSAADAHAKSIQAITDRFSGAGAIKAARDFVEAITGKVDLLRVTDEALAEINKTTREGIDVFARHGKIAPEAMRLLYIESTRLPPVINGIGDSVSHLGDTLDLTIPKLPKLADAIGLISGLTAMPGTDIGTPTAPKVPLAFWQQMFGDKATVKGVLGDTIGGALNALSQGGFKGLAQFGVQFAKDFTAGLVSMIPGIGPMLSQAVGPLVDMIGKAFDRNKGRDLVKDFAASMGGFDGPGGLHAKLLELGDEGERLWIRLTQGVGRNNPQQAKAAIDAIEEAFAKARDTAKESSTAQVSAIQSTLDAAQSALKGLDDQLSSLWASIADEAPEEITKDNPLGMGVVEAQTRARIAALTKEREAAAQTVQDLQAELTKSTDRVAEAIERIPREIEIRVRTLFDGERPEVPSHDVGAYIREDHLAMVHAGEMIGDENFFAAAVARALTAIGGTPGGEMTVRVPVHLDGRVITEVVAKNMKGVLATYGVRG